MFLVILVVNGSYGELIVYLIVLVVLGCVLGYVVELVMYWLVIGCIQVKSSWVCIGSICN